MKSTNIIDVECNDTKIKEVKKMVYRDLEIYAVKRSLDSRGLISGSFFGTNAEWWCGYVEVPEDMHNLFKPEGHLDTTILDELDDPDSYDLAHVHEGYTYLDNGIPRVLDNGQKLFLGWDYNHCCDIGADVTYDDIVDEGKRVIDSMLEKMKEETAMPEYTRKDIIMDPNDPRLEGAIGKKVYCSSDINLTLQRANDDEYEKTLTQVEDVDSEPFTVVDMDGDELDADFIIIKKEEEPEYVPFESIEEFMTAYFKSVANSECIQKTISSTGIWLKHNDAFLLVVEIWDRGVVVGNGKMETMNIGEDTYLTTNFITDWHELYEKYTFLDGSPCGKEVR